jgi:glycosyltransferase A (GT-A) superfamily protein (DUF2064 family)
MYAKIPEPGQVKTRLTKGENSLSNDEAADLYRAMLTDLVAQFSISLSYDFFICPKGEMWRLRKEIKGDYFLLEDEGKGDLGDSIYKSFIWLIEREYTHICIIGSDSPFLTIELVDKAFKALENGSPFVLGPDHGGGCYLIGANQPYPIFCDIPWSQGKDFSILKDRLDSSMIPLSVLPVTQDLDIAKDLITAYDIITKNPESFKKRMPRTYKYIEMFHMKHPSFF